MDYPWNLSRWYCSMFGGKITRPGNLELIATSIRTATLSLKVLPMDPELWLLRADLLKKAGYPELAIGDAYKGKLLIDSLIKKGNRTQEGDDTLLCWGMRKWLEHQTDPDLLKTWSDPPRLGAYLFRLQQQMQLQLYIVLSDVLFMAVCFWDCLVVAREGIKHFPNNKELSSIINDAREMINKKLLMERPPGMPEDHYRAMVRGGQVEVVPYPWMTKDTLVRSRDLMDSLAKSLKFKTDLCRLQQIALSTKKRQKDSYGIYAQKTIRKGQLVLVDPATVCASSSTRSCPTCVVGLVYSAAEQPDDTNYQLSCCRTVFCTKECAEKARHTFHEPMCSKDLSHLDQVASKASIDEFLRQQTLAKVLAGAIHENLENPLFSSVLGHLKPHNFGGHLPISLEYSYAVPFKTLRALGIDIFADFRFDTWIIHVISCRLMNNGRQVKFREATCSAMNEHQTFFNHSCDPTLIQETAETDMSTLVYTARRKIVEGEELCVSYVDDEYFFKADEMERQEYLLPWFSEPCWCQKCEVERDSKSRG